MNARRILAVVFSMLSVLASFAGARSGAGHTYLLVWAGDWNASDLSRGTLADPGALSPGLVASAGVGPDFLAVIDAEPSSPDYGKVVRTVTVPGVENEPHHMQYTWRTGDRVYAGGLFSDHTFVFDVDHLPDVSLVGDAAPVATPCGSVPDAYWVLSDGTALGTEMGGPDVAGDPRCNGGDSNGYAGTPGEVARFGRDGSVLGEFPAAGNDPADARAGRCLSIPPLVRPSCANPHGIQVREDLGLMVTSDYAEPRNVPTDPVSPVDDRVFRDTVRVWNVSNLSGVSVRSVSVMPLGAAAVQPPAVIDPRGVMGVMETTVTNLPAHRGAFASSMCGGQVYYTADISSAHPFWTQVFDASAAAERVHPGIGRLSGCSGAGWLQTSPDDSVLFSAVIGRNPGTLSATDPGVPKMVYALDIRSLLAVPPSSWTDGNGAVCSIDTAPEITAGGAEGSCPSVAGAVELPDASSGGPHWGTIDGFSLSGAAGRLTGVTRIATSDYFVARSGTDGNHKVCMLTVDANGSLSMDSSFVDENEHTPCVDFNRLWWPHGPFGFAKPHAVLFVHG